MKLRRLESAEARANQAEEQLRDRTNELEVRHTNRYRTHDFEYLTSCNVTVYASKTRRSRSIYTLGDLSQ